MAHDILVEGALGRHMWVWRWVHNVGESVGTVTVVAARSVEALVHPPRMVPSSGKGTAVASGLVTGPLRTDSIHNIEVKELDYLT